MFRVYALDILFFILINKDMKNLIILLILLLSSCSSTIYTYKIEFKNKESRIIHTQKAIKLKSGNIYYNNKCDTAIRNVWYIEKRQKK